MSWDEIYNHKKPTIHDAEAEKARSVYVSGSNKQVRNRAASYLLSYTIGSVVMRDLGFAKDTHLKFQWGSRDLLGKLRIVPVHNEDVSGWYPRVTAKKHGIIYSTTYPSTILTRDRPITKVSHVILDDPRDTGLKILEIQLPNDFYKSTETTPVGRSKIYVPNEVLRPVVAVTSQSLSKNERLERDYQNLMVVGGLISIETLCMFLRRQSGDSCRVVDDKFISLNDHNVPYRFALNKANEIRHNNKQPLFTLTASS